MDINEIITKLKNKQNLSKEECQFAMQNIMSGKLEDKIIADFLLFLKEKGETPLEIASLALTMREFAEKINPKVDGLLVDTCGTGGDKIKTFNISTAAMFVIAGTGIPIAKHGNRAITSNAGSADVLETLGVKIDLEPKQVEKCIEQVGIGFMFAPIFHKAMKYVMPVRKSLKTRTVFNILGPLTNPASAQCQVLGVFSPELTEQMAEVLKIMGTKHAMVVYGVDGLDEISTIGETKISELKDNEIKTYFIKPEDFGINKAKLEDLLGKDAKYNAELLKEILDPNKKDSSARDIVLLNAAAGIVVGGKANNLDQGLKLARESISSGKAQEKLLEFVRVSNEI